MCFLVVQPLASVRVAGQQNDSVTQVRAGADEVCGCGLLGSTAGAGAGALQQCDYRAWRLDLALGQNLFNLTFKVWWLEWGFGWVSGWHCFKMGCRMWRECLCGCSGRFESLLHSFRWVLQRTEPSLLLPLAGARARQQQQ